MIIKCKFYIIREKYLDSMITNKRLEITFK